MLLWDLRTQREILEIYPASRPAQYTWCLTLPAVGHVSSVVIDGAVLESKHAQHSSFVRWRGGSLFLLLLLRNSYGVVCCKCASQFLVAKIKQSVYFTFKAYYVNPSRESHSRQPTIRMRMVRQPSTTRVAPAWCLEKTKVGPELGRQEETRKNRVNKPRLQICKYVLKLFYFTTCIRTVCLTPRVSINSVNYCPRVCP